MHTVQVANILVAGPCFTLVDTAVNTWKAWLCMRVAPTRYVEGVTRGGDRPGTCPLALNITTACVDDLSRFATFGQ